MSHLPDEVLARRAAAGHLDCFEELLARYRDRVYRICYRSAGNAEDAEDWAQESFLRVYQQLGRYNPAMPFTPWLLRVVANTCINLAKRRARRRERLELGLRKEALGSAISSDPLGTTISQEETRAILDAVGELAPSLQEAIVLRVVEGLSFRELAEILGVPLQTAATRVRRALEQVRAQLARSGVEVER